MRRPWVLLAGLAGAAVIAMAWKEIPAMIRYIKIERM
jgi:hypothetical protein